MTGISRLTQVCSSIKEGGFPALPAQPSWLLQLPAIRAALSELTVPVFDRAVIEEVFGVRRRRAIELMHRFGGFQAGKTFLVDRASLLRQLEMIEQGGDFAHERKRRRLLSENLDQAKALVRARAVRIAPSRGEAADLPATVQLRPGEMRIEFTGVEDLLRQLLAVAIAVQNDPNRFAT